MPSPVIVDTNVALTANGDATHASIQCQQACVDILERITQEGKILLDEQGFIITEYLDQHPYGFPQGVGDMFFVWANDNQWSPEYCRRVSITPLSEFEFEEFPTDPALDGFDKIGRAHV